ncbi:MAG TPA: SDR family oxidoreductase [Polyangiaceae bacterium]|nr:SDR family oxidoreductase [Polyangiaceae bacterium]
MNLVIGATGVLGQEVVRLLCEARKPVRALVRPGASAEKSSRLESLGATLVRGDLKHPSSLRDACAGASTIVSTASATLSRQEGDSIESVDERGQLALIDAAEAAGVGHFVYLSFAPLSVDCALQRAKRAVEARLRESKLSFTVLQPVDFMEIWLSPALGFDPVHGKARIFGSGERPVSWISLFDVARFAAAATEDPKLAGRVVPLGGPDALSPLQVLEIFRELGGPEVELERVPESALEAQLSVATNPLEEAFAALMLSTARGYVVSSREAVELLPGRLCTVREYAKQVLQNTREKGEINGQ